MIFLILVLAPWASSMGTYGSRMGLPTDKASTKYPLFLKFRLGGRGGRRRSLAIGAKPKVLIADRLPEDTIRRMGERFDVENRPDLGAGDLPLLLTSFQALVVRSTRVTAEALEKAENLKLIIRAGAGLDTIDILAAQKSGIEVHSCKGANAAAVAELTFGLMLSIDREIPRNIQDFRTRKWSKPSYSPGQGLRGRRLGIIGMGHIGARVAEIGRGFGMRVTGWGRSFCESKAEVLGIDRAETIEDVLREADFLTVHLPLTTQTRHILSAERLKLLKENSIIVNMARGGVIDENALAAAVANGRIRAGGDVYEHEPTDSGAEITSPLAELENYQGTHHIGGLTIQAQEAIGEGVIGTLEDFFYS
ncbi:hypothetical protein AAMO2058_000121400 [Amorphochlora amoebiformis]